MQGRVRLIVCLMLLALCSHAALAQTPSFEEMIEETLRRDQANPPPAGPGEPATPGEPGAPSGAQPADPFSAPQEPQLVPVEPGPRAYTPPKLERRPDAAEPRRRATGATPADQPPAANGATATESGTNAEGTAAPVAERTRESLTVEEVNGASFPAELPPIKGASPLVLKAQVLLDRAGASPGAIDAYQGGNLQKAISAVETVLGLPVDGILDKTVWDALGGDAAPPVLVQYTITPEDLAYPFVSAIPEDYAEQARLPSLGFTSPQEMLGERFHMDTKLLSALNPNADFRQPGTQIWVAAVDGPPITAKIARIEADKAARQVRAYDAANRLVVAYPATIGSEETPSPSGDHRVDSVAPNPVYYYDPRNFVQGGNLEKLQLPPGPNNPVGTVWIDLTEPGYGIHGTPEPTRIGKTASHGCVRLTNWDAEELSHLVEPGIVVSFLQ